MNRVKRFFARLEEKMVFRACVFAALLMLIAGTMFLLNAHTPLQMDDYDYAFSWSTGKPLSGVADVLASQAAHYRLWGGRSVVHTLTQLFLYAGKGAFNVANTAIYVLLVLELYALVRPKGRRFCWPVLRSSRFSEPFFSGWTARVITSGVRRWRFCRFCLC